MGEGGEDTRKQSGGRGAAQEQSELLRPFDTAEVARSPDVPYLDEPRERAGSDGEAYQVAGARVVDEEEAEEAAIGRSDLYDADADAEDQDEVVCGEAEQRGRTMFLVKRRPGPPGQGRLPATLWGQLMAPSSDKGARYPP